MDFLVEVAKFASMTPGWISASVHRSHDGTRVVNYAQTESLEAAQRVIDRLRDAQVALGHLLFGPVLSYQGRDSDGKRRTMRIRARWFSKPDELAGRTLWHAAFRRSPRR